MYPDNSYDSIQSNYPPGTIPLNNTHTSIQHTYTIPPYPSQIIVIPPPYPLLHRKFKLNSLHLYNSY